MPKAYVHPDHRGVFMWQPETGRTQAAYPGEKVDVPDHILELGLGRGDLVKSLDDDLDTDDAPDDDAPAEAQHASDALVAPAVVLESYDYQALQALAKDLKIPAGGSRDELLDRVRDAVAGMDDAARKQAGL